MNILIVGSGGREHSLAWKLAQSPRLERLHAAPGNPGIAQLGDCHPVRAEDGDGLLALARELDIDLAVVGPEAPLVTGVADRLRHAGVSVFGPGAAAARIEGSKSFAKEVMRAAGVPSAEQLAVARPPCVIKADGLAAGKGVFVCRTHEELDAALKAVSGLGDAIVIEELLEGEELSVFAVCDGVNAFALAPAQDFKRLEDGDAGPNTGGMGSCSPVPWLDVDVDELVEKIHRPVLGELALRGTPFIGLLYAGLMLTDSGPRVLEFNCRFGDPETQSILPRLEGDLLPALEAAARGDVGEVGVEVGDDAAVTVVICGRDPLGGGDHGTPIAGVEDAAATGALVFHAGTAERDGRLMTNGRRILNVTGLGRDVAAARAVAYEGVQRISFPEMRYRSDIAAKSERVHS
jgi:phosphoribosylamine---glycine ligase